MFVANSSRGAPNVKRQRTNSQSQSPPAGDTEEPNGEHSEADAAKVEGRKARGPRHERGARNEDGQNHRAKSEKADRDRQRQEAADKRRLRADNRRSGTSEEHTTHISC